MPAAVLPRALEDKLDDLAQHVRRLRLLRGLSRLALALLVTAGLAQHADKFLPTFEAAQKEKDLEALNLLSRHFLTLMGEPGERAGNLEKAWHAVQAVLQEWTQRLRAETGEGFPEKVTAFREGMAVHGRYRQPCPTCGTPVQRIRYAENETNYCPSCQTEGRLLADRGLSRLLKEDWPRSLEELDQRLKS